MPLLCLVDHHPLVFRANDPAIDRPRPPILKAMVIGNQETFSRVDFDDLVGVDVAAFHLAKDNIPDVVLRSLVKG